MEKNILLLLPIVFLFLFVFNVSFMENLKFDLLYINIFIIFLLFFIIRNRNYIKAKSAVYFGILNFYVFGMIMTYDYSQKYNNSDVRWLFLFSNILFLIIYVFTYELLKFKNYSNKRKYYNNILIFRFAITTFFIVVCVNLYMNVSSYGSLINSLTISYGLKDYEQSNYLLYSYHLIIPSILIIIWYGLYYKKRSFNYRFIRNIGIFLSLIVMIITKSRGNILELVFSIIFLVLLMKNERKIGIGMKLKIIVVVLISFIIIMGIGLVRNYNIGNGEIVISKEVVERNIFGSFDQMNIYYFILENLPENFDYLYGRSFATTFLNFVPRSVWANKPVSFGNEIMIYKYGHIIKNYAVAPSYIGEWYANFGFFGIFLGAIFLGIITKYIDSKMYSRKEVLWIVFLIISIFYFWRLMRGDFQSATIPYIIKVLYLLILKFISRFKSLNKKV